MSRKSRGKKRRSAAQVRTAVEKMMELSAAWRARNALVPRKRKQK